MGIEILKDQQLQQKKMKAKSKCWEKQWDGLVFTTINGNPVGASTFRTMMGRICKNINEDRKILSDDYETFEPVTMHGLRHTFATRAIESGIQPKTLQKIMGHSSLAITMDLYVHVTDEHSFLEMEKLMVV